MRTEDLLPGDLVRLPTWPEGTRGRVSWTEGDTVYLKGVRGEWFYTNCPFHWILVSRPGPDPERRGAAYRSLLALCGVTLVLFLTAEALIWRYDTRHLQFDAAVLGLATVLGLAAVRGSAAMREMTVIQGLAAVLGLLTLLSAAGIIS